MLKAINTFISRYKGSILRASLVSADNLLAYCLNKKPSFGLLYVGWNVTFRCNCECDFCKSNSFAGAEELTTEECIEIVKSLGAHKVSLLSITGGEPLLREDLYDIIAVAKKTAST